MKTRQDAYFKLVQNTITKILETSVSDELKLQAEKVLQETNRLQQDTTKKPHELLYGIQEIAQIGGWELDVSTGKTRWTDEVYRIHGVPIGADTYLDMGLSFYAESERPRLMSALEGALKGQPFREVFEFFDLQKRHKWVEVTARPEIGADKKVAKLKGTFQDVTVKQEALNSLKLHKSLLDEAQRIAKIGSWTYDLLGGDLFWSSEHYRIFEIGEPQKSDELFALYQSRIHPEDSKKLDLLVERAVRLGEDYIFDHRVYLDGGRRIKNVRGIGKVTKDSSGRVVQLSGTCQDLTTLIQLQEQNRLILNSMGIGIWEYNPTTKELIWDSSMYDLFEVDAKNFSGHYDAWEKSLSAEAKEKAIHELDLALSGKKEFSTTFEIVTPNGNRKYIGGKGVVKRNEIGEAIMMYGINWDRTRDVEMEKAVEREKAKAMQNAKMASLGELAAGVAHEINNPLAMVMGAIPLLKKQYADETSAQKFDSILSAGKRIEKIVKGLKRFSRTSEGIEKGWHSLSGIVNEALILTEAKAKRHKTKVSLKTVEDSDIFCDPLEIEQVIINIVNNGIDAAKVVSNRWVEIELLKLKDDLACVRICDSGPGVKPEDVDKVFQPFYTTKPVGEGTGLGLAISNGIIDSHGGKIRIDTSHAFTCFELLIPRRASGG